jgi:hypothetical protein
MSLLDLLSAIASPELTLSERTHIRSLVSAERPPGVGSAGMGGAAPGHRA